MWGEVELAWWVDRCGATGPPRTWLVVTGTNGKTTTTAMVEQIVAAAGRSVAACGNYGTPVLDILTRAERTDVLCRGVPVPASLGAVVAAGGRVVLNVAEDHLDWHGGMAAYAGAKAGALRGGSPSWAAMTRLPRPAGGDGLAARAVHTGEPALKDNSGLSTGCSSTGLSAMAQS